MVQEIMKTCLELDPRTVKEMQEDDPRVNLVFATVADQVDDVIIQENIKPELDNFIDEVIKERGNK
jgi:alcohol dehydrogenase YqhD (iron-dependent ADH family)